MAGREKKGTPRVAAKSGEEVAQGAGGVSEACGGLAQGELIDADGAEASYRRWLELVGLRKWGESTAIEYRNTDYRAENTNRME